MNLKKVTASLLTLATVAASPVAAFAQSARPTKIYQCNQIIKIANEAVTEAKQVTNNGQASDPVLMLRAASAMDSAAASMARVSITDQTLKGYQSRFISMYRQTSQADRNFATAYNRGDRTAASSALRTLQAATAPERQLVSDINNYCSGGTGRTNRL